MSGNLAGQIDGFLKQKSSPLAGLGSVFVATGKKYGVDPRLVVGISGIESSFGKYIPTGTNNAWGWGPGEPFGSWQEGISTVTRGLANGYINQGRTTPAAISTKYAPASAGNDPAHWSQVVSDFMKELGASSLASKAMVIASAAAPAAVPSSNGLPSSSDLLGALLPIVSTPPSTFGVQQAALQSLSNVAVRGHPDPLSDLQALAFGRLQDIQSNRQNRQTALLQALGELEQAQPSAGTGNTPTSVTHSSVPTTELGKVTVAPSANRQGVGIKPAVLDFVGKIAGLFGPITVGTGTNHNQFVSGTNNSRQSAHWLGNAVDIPASGDTLTKLGRDALLAAGMPRAQALKADGGVYNLGPYQIIFNTTLAQGGNHWNHLHVGVSG